MKSRPHIGGIFFAFLKLGFTAFGGPAMIQNIGRLVVEKQGWLEKDVFRRGVAFCQAIPGATAMQTAAFAGLKIRGMSGAVAAFAGFGLPAFLIMCALSYLYGRVGFPPVLFSGMRLAVIAITFHAALSLGRSGFRKWYDAAFVAVGLTLFLFTIHPVVTIVCASALALLINRPVSQAGVGAGAGSGDGAGSPGIWKPLVALCAAAALVLAVLKVFRPEVFTLCLTMARIDLMAFGGGFASVPLMMHEVVENLALMPQYDFINGIALGQITPGPLIITATFVGYVSQGLTGAVLATFFVFLPSFILVCGLSGAYERLSGAPRVKVALDGIFLSFVGLIAGAGVRMILQNPMDFREAAICTGLFLLLLLRVPTLCAVIAGVAVSWVLL